ncbi:hypothetical protein Btru_054921, partial [Bulinus truncatus]
MVLLVHIITEISGKWISKTDQSGEFRKLRFKHGQRTDKSHSTDLDVPEMYSSVWGEEESANLLGHFNSLQDVTECYCMLLYVTLCYCMLLYGEVTLLYEEYTSFIVQQGPGNIVKTNVMEVFSGQICNGSCHSDFCELRSRISVSEYYMSLACLNGMAWIKVVNGDMTVFGKVVLTDSKEFIECKGVLLARCVVGQVCCWPGVLLARCVVGQVCCWPGVLLARCVVGQ